MSTQQKVKLDLTGIDGNAFAIMGAFQKAARRQGWPKDQIKEVLDEATSGDYDHLLATIQSNVNDGHEDEEPEIEPAEAKDDFTQLCVWEGVTLKNPDGSTAYTPEEFEQWMSSEHDIEIEFCEEVVTGPGKGGTGGRTDLFFYMANESIRKHAVKRLQMGIRWWEDVLGNGNGVLYPQEILDKYPKTW